MSQGPTGIFTAAITEPTGPRMWGSTELASRFLTSGLG